MENKNIKNLIKQNIFLITQRMNNPLFQKIKIFLKKLLDIYLQRKRTWVEYTEGVNNHTQR